MRAILATAIFSAAIIAAFPAFASGRCNPSQGPQLTVEQVTAKAESLGYKVRKVKMEDGCYEAYAINASGQRLEVYIDPVSGEIVQQKSED